MVWKNDAEISDIASRSSEYSLLKAKIKNEVLPLFYSAELSFNEAFEAW